MCFISSPYGKVLELFQIAANIPMHLKVYLYNLLIPCHFSFVFSGVCRQDPQRFVWRFSDTSLWEMWYYLRSQANDGPSHRHEQRLCVRHIYRQSRSKWGRQAGEFCSSITLQWPPFIVEEISVAFWHKNLAIDLLESNLHWRQLRLLLVYSYLNLSELFTI